jgi:4-amino-4-deoxy-L-arabinose transferase-like glycosyltransferase
LYEWWREIAGAIVVLVSRLLTAPKTIWENDEFLFAEAVRNFDPSRYHPHPPGYPLYVLLGKAFNVVFDDPFRSLVALGIVASVLGVIGLTRYFRIVLGDPDLAVCGALLFYFSASALLHSTLALSDVASLLFVALALVSICRGGEEGDHERDAILVGVWCSAAIGVRPQLLLPVLPMLAIALWQMRTMRQRVAAVAAFAFVSLMWLLPLVDAAGGVNAVIAYEQKQAQYFATHDAAMSRGSKSATEIAIRFLLHPWGSKYITLPLLLFMALGVLPLWRRRSSKLLPLLAFTAVQVAFELATMDPADGARYALPSMIFFALLAAAGFDALRRSTRIALMPWLATAFFAAISWWYVGPILRARTSGPSPVAAAADYANRTFPPNTVILYDLSLRPAAEYLMHFKTIAIEPGLRVFYASQNVPLVQFVDGGTHSGEAKAFSWPASDAYGKLTRNHYRQVSLDPVRPEERYLPMRGVYPLERTVEGEEWRWLAKESAIVLPALGAGSVRIGLRISPDAPYDTNVVQFFANEEPAGRVSARKGEVVKIDVPVPDGATLRMVTEQSFAPASVLHNQDPRLLAVQLTEVVQSPLRSQ